MIINNEERIPCFYAKAFDEQSYYTDLSCIVVIEEEW